jgi:hypothetical protein
MDYYLIIRKERLSKNRASEPEETVSIPKYKWVHLEHSTVLLLLESCTSKKIFHFPACENSRRYKFYMGFYYFIFTVAGSCAVVILVSSQGPMFGYYAV